MKLIKVILVLLIIIAVSVFGYYAVTDTDIKQVETIIKVQEK